MHAQATPKDDDAVIAAMRSWVEKAVIGLNLCPFARSVYVAEQVRFVVSRAPHLDGFLETLDSELDFLAAADPQTLDTTLLMAPELFADEFLIVGQIGDEFVRGIQLPTGDEPAQLSRSESAHVLADFARKSDE